MIERIKSRLKRAASRTPGHLSFRQRYSAIEARRDAMIERLKAMDEQARAHPGYKRAFMLLNERFRQAKVAQRVAILQAAEWLIDVLETLTLIA